MPQTKKTLYDILGVSRDTGANDISLAYDKRKAELEQAGAAPGELSLLRQARDTLADAGRREAYDASLRATEERSAAALQQAPDPAIDDAAQPGQRKPPWLAIIGVVAVIAIATLFAMRSNKAATTKPDNAPSPGTAETVQPVQPPKPTAKSGMEVIAVASLSGGQVLSFSMSGQAIPIGIAVSTEDGMMITTCHGIPAGAKLVVRVQGQSYPADLVITDEVLDLCKLQVADFHTPPLKLATDEPKAGDRIYVVGANKAGEFAVTEGTLKRVLDTTEGRLYELSMPIGEFSSGGGVFDAFGKLVGIATYQHRAGISVAYPATSIAQMKSRHVAARGAAAQ